MLDFGFYNMDCMEGMRQFPDKYFDLAIVDPPYGISVEKMNLGVGGGVARNKNYLISDKAHTFYDKAPDNDYFKELFRVSKNQIIWGGNNFVLPKSSGWIVWDKEKPEGVSFADCELAWTSFDRAVRMFRYAWNGMLQGDMKNKEKRIHPTQKPIRLYTWILQNYAKEGDLILDTHVGSASSLIACERMGFQYVGFEIDKEYYRLAQKRLEEERAQVKWELQGD